MDLNDLRSVITVVSLLLFVVLVVSVWLPRRRAQLEEAAQLPFIGEERGHE